MNDLDDQARALIELARDGDDPTVEDRARVQRRLASVVAAGGALTLGAKAAEATALSAGAGAPGAAGLGATATISSPAIAKGAGGTAGLIAGSWTTTKIAVVLFSGLMSGALAAGAVGFALYDEAAPDREDSRTNAASGARATAPRPPPAVSGSPDEDVGDSRDTAETSSSKAPGERPITETAAPVAEPLRPPAPARPRNDVQAVSRASIAEETRLLEAARAALAAGDGAGALAEVRTHASRFPDGVLTEEAGAVRILALCRIGRVSDAKRAAQAFMQVFPASPQQGRLSASCAGSREIP